MRITKLKLAMLGVVIWVLSMQMAYAGKIPVYVGVNASSVIGVNLGYAVKEAVRRSSTMSLVADTEDGYLFLMITAFDPPIIEYAGFTFYSVVFSAKSNVRMLSYYLENFVGYCGVDRINTCADNTVAMADELLTKIMKAYLAQ